MFEIHPSDPRILLATASLLVLTGLVSAWLPARRASRIDPKTGLHPAAGEEGVEEVFLDGTAPKESAGSPDEAAAADRLLMQGGAP